MNTKACNLCKCSITPTYAMKHLHEFMDKVCEHENTLQNIQTNKFSIEFANTFASINSSIEKRIIFVNSDETNLNIPTLYVHDGVGLQYVPTQKIY